MISDALKTEIADNFGTPAVVVDLDRVAHNIARVQAVCDAAGVANRPHIKTHKSPVLAKMQVAAGARGITCQKLGEAEVMADAGLDDILVTYNLLGREKMERLGRLLRRGLRITVAADNATVVDGLAEAARLGERELGVVVDCDTGRRRTGVETPAEAVALARRIAATEGLAFRGFMFYPPESAWRETQAFFDEALAGVRAHGLEPEIVSTGGTPNLPHVGKLKGATEHRAGTSIFNDRTTIAWGACSLDDCALAVLTTVVSRAGPRRGIVDAGSKTLTADPGRDVSGYGLMLEHPGVALVGFAEEHGFLDLSGAAVAGAEVSDNGWVARPVVGERVSIVPNHVCVVVNMVDRLIGVRDGRVAEVLEVEARGAIL